MTATPAATARRVTQGRTWWARNKLWLFLLAPLLALALATTGFRLVRIYLPWHYTRPQQTAASTLPFAQDWSYNSRMRFHRTVTITVVSVEPVNADGGRTAAPGGMLYRVGLQFAAPPDVILDGCTVLLVGPDGTLYGDNAGKVDAPASSTPSSTTTIRCVPEDSPGPTIDPLKDEIEPAATPRPASWSVTTSIVLPSAVKPAQVRVQWVEPDYAVLAIPV